MDALDVRILRTLGLLPFVGTPRHPDSLRPAHVARQLKRSTRTVRERMARLEKDGVILGYDVVPNPRHLELHWTTYHVLVSGPKANVLRAVAPLDGLVGTMDFFGNDLCLDLVYRDERELRRRLELLRGLVGAQPVAWYETSLPAPKGDLTPLDWRILGALRGNARRHLDEVAARTGVSQRTVKRRIARLLRDGHMDQFAMVDPGHLPRSIAFALLLRLDPARANAVKSTLAREFDDNILWAWAPPVADIADFVLLLRADASAFVEQMRARAATLPGVKEAAILLPCGGTERREWLDEAIDRRAQGLSRDDVVSGVKGHAARVRVPLRHPR